MPSLRLSIASSTWLSEFVSSPSYNSGSIGQAVSLNGQDDYITLPDNLATSDDITISTWFFWRGGKSWQRIFDFGSNTNSYMMLTPSINANMMVFAITTGSYMEEQTLVTEPLPLQQWTHISLTLRGNTAKLYINGDLRVAGHIYANPSDLFDAALSQHNYIGKSQWASDPMLNGAIDDFRIYNYALIDAEVLNLYNAI